jgi:hypothetical protein
VSVQIRSSGIAKSCIQRNSAGLTRLVVVRGNSGSGKSSTALAVRSRLGRTCALVALSDRSSANLYVDLVKHVTNMCATSTVIVFTSFDRTCSWILTADVDRLS